MNLAKIDAAIEKVYADIGMGALPRSGPIPLVTLIEGQGLGLFELPELSPRVIAQQASSYGIDLPFSTDTTPLAGYIVADAGNRAIIFVRKEDPIARRRFSAAHELGHFLLHFQADEPLEPGEIWQESDQISAVRDGEPSATTPEQEREANTFAARLLLPLSRFRTPTPSMKLPHPTERFWVHQLASDCLVSWEMARWRLREFQMR